LGTKQVDDKGAPNIVSMEYRDEIFDPYDRLVTISICGRTYEVPENNTILRCLQYVDMDAVSDGEFCWNGECLNCQVWVRTEEKEKAVMACRAEAEDRMEITRVAKAVEAVLPDGAD
jgi:hypothetical protein